jgi:hypothetical protein
MNNVFRGDMSGSGTCSSVDPCLLGSWIWRMNFLLVWRGLDYLKGDSWSWRYTPDRIYFVRSSCVVLFGEALRNGDVNDSVVSMLRHVWRSWAPSKV